MTEDLLLVERGEGICTLTINRPDKRNSLNPEILTKLGDTLNELRDNPDIRVVIIRGMGKEAFSSGYDIGRIPVGAPGELRAHPLDYGTQCIIDYPYPVIAMIYGYAVGAGLELAVTCDLRLAADTAKLGIPPAKLGIVYRHQGIQRLLNVVGIAQAKELLFTGRIIDAQRAAQIGLVDRVVPQRELASVTCKLAAEIAENAPLALSGTKKVINTLFNYQTPSSEDQALMEELRDRSMQSEDVKEGQKAFMEKRKPKFVGR